MRNMHTLTLTLLLTAAPALAQFDLDRIFREAPDKPSNQGNTEPP